MSVIIDSGHQGIGYDPGAVGNGIVEADLVLQISLYQFKRFKELGVPVKLTRDRTIALSNDKRASLIKNSGMRHCICNHINASGGDGAEIIVSIYSNQKWAEIIKRELLAVGQNFRRIFTRTLANGKDYYNVHRSTGSVETVLVEYGFLDSRKDDVQQLKNEWERMAEAVVKAYCEYAKYDYKAPLTVEAPKQEVKTEVKESDEIMLTNTGREEIRALLKKARDKGIIDAKMHTDTKIATYTDLQLISYQAAVINRTFGYK